MKVDEYNLGDDQPKRNPWQDDMLEHAPFARRLANVVINMNIPNGYVIGLHGRWGSGKTTAVNFVLEYIKKYNQEKDDGYRAIEHIDFRPWIISGHQDLMAAFFKQFSEHLKQDGAAARIWKRGMRTLAQNADPLVNAAATLALTIDPSGGAISGLAGNIAKQSLGKALGRWSCPYLAGQSAIEFVLG